MTSSFLYTTLTASNMWDGRTQNPNTELSNNNTTTINIFQHRFYLYQSGQMDLYGSEHQTFFFIKNHSLINNKLQ